ncbi:MAG: dihydrodipicolinate synthase family protein, partial [Verrucomicrobiota bacterium]
MNKKYQGVVVPMVTPITPAGAVDLFAANRIVEHLLQGGVDGVFALGTTGEGASVPQAEALRLVKSVVQQVGERALVYAGVNNNCIFDAATTGNQYLSAGADALVLLPPSYFPLQPSELFYSIKQLLDRLEGPAFLYNIPATTHHSIPLDIIEKLLGHPRLVGLKDSENDAQRLEKLVSRFSECPTFSLFIGVGMHMATMLSLGADGIVPSVGNLVPEICTKLTKAIR